MRRRDVVGSKNALTRMIASMLPTPPWKVIGLIVGLATILSPADTVIFPREGSLYVSRSDGKEPGLHVLEAAQPGQPPQFSATRRIGDAVKHLLPSFPGGKLRLASPGWTYEIDQQKGLKKIKPLLLPMEKIDTALWSLADYNGDGRCDVIVFSRVAEDAKARIFYGRADESHAAAFVFQVDGKDFDATGVHSPHFVNLDDDDDLDFFHLDAEGRLIYYENRNTNSEPLYAAGRRLRSELMQAIVPTDWDGDSLIDLILVTQGGEIGWMKQKARHSGQMPAFSEVSFFAGCR